MARLRLYVDGNAQELSFDSFLGVMGNALDVLRDLDSAISSDPDGTLKWVITELGLGSATVGIQSVNVKPPTDYSSEVAASYVDGLQQIEYEGSTPPYFSDFDLRKTQQLARLLTTNGAWRFRATYVDGQKTAEITSRAGTNAAQLTAPKHRSLGSVTGRLEMISVHRGNRFSVYDALTRRAVGCGFKEDMLELVKDALGRRVLASGIVQYNFKGEAIRVQLESLEMLPREDELPSPETIRGMAPDFTGDLKTEEFLRRVRDA